MVVLQSVTKEQDILSRVREYEVKLQATEDTNRQAMLNLRKLLSAQQRMSARWAPTYYILFHKLYLISYAIHHCTGICMKICFVSSAPNLMSWNLQVTNQWYYMYNKKYVCLQVERRMSLYYTEAWGHSQWPEVRDQFTKKEKCWTVCSSERKSGKIRWCKYFLKYNFIIGTCRIHFVTLPCADTYYI